MDKSLHLILPLPISVNALYQMQYAYSKKYRQNMPTGRKILSDAGRIKKKEIIKSATAQMRNQEWNLEITKNHFIYQDIHVYFNRKNRDSDNILKLLNDSLQGIVFHNDSKVLTRVQRIYYDHSNPRVECAYSVCEWLGIFDNIGEYDKFLSQCHSCKHYRDNRCSILTDSVQGVIRQEVVNQVCQKYVLKKGEQ
jgi:Holliday junction resolvase RusA-like endonuclease